MKNVKFMKLFSGLLAVFFLMVSAPMTSFAYGSDTDGGGDTGGGGGGGGLGGSISFKWNVAAGSKGYAWSKFIGSQKHTGYNTEAKVVNLLNQKSVNVNICRNATAIWWVSSHQGGEHWVQNFTGATYGANKSGSVAGTLENPAVVFNRNATGIEQSNIKKWAGSNLYKKPGYTVLCSYRDPETIVETDTKFRNNVKNSVTTDTDTYTHTEVYSYSTSVVPMPIEGEMVAGEEWTPEPSVVQKTNFGKMYDDLATNDSNISTDELRARVANAEKADKNGTLTTDVTISEENRKRFAKGGILNVYEHKIMATVTAETETTIEVTETQPQKQVCERTKTFNPSTGLYNGWSSWSCGGWVNDGSATSTPKISKSHNVTRSIQTPQNTGFWQMISVHCNEEQFNALIEATGAEVLKVGGNNKEGNKISAVAQTKKYDSQPSSLDFGDPSNPNEAAAASGYMDFFDKECPFDCEPTLSNNNTGNNGNNGNNGTVNSGYGGSGKSFTYGASITGHEGKVSGNFFELFRDNDPKILNVDIWRPVKGGGLVKYKDEDALTTTISRWENGTPGVSRNNGGKFTMKSTKLPTVELFSGSAPNEKQINWKIAPFSNSTSTILSGEHNEFTIQSSWASEIDRPEVLNFKWEYEADVSTKLPKAFGFTRKGITEPSVALTRATSTVIADDVQGKCYANFGTNDSIETKDLFQNNTGSGTPNNLDGTLVGGTGNNFSDVSTNLVLNFVRATAE